MKSIARSFVYWSGIDTDIKQTTKSCIECAKHAHVPPKFTIRKPWEHIHVDYAGPIAGTMLFIVIS